MAADRPRLQTVRIVAEVPVAWHLDREVAMRKALTMIGLEIRKVEQVKGRIDLDMLEGEPSGDIDLRVESIVAGRNGQPYVVLRLGRERLQVTPAEAWQWCRWIAEASQAAITDAFLVTFLEEKLELPEEMAAAIMQDFRGYRRALAERDEC